MASPYDVAIHLTVTGNAQAGLAGIAQQVGKLNEGVKNLHKSFALIFAGGEMKRWGEEALGSVKKILDAAGNFQQVQNQMSAMGMAQKEIAASVASSWGLAKDNIHIGVQEIAQMNRHAIEIFGSASAAAEHMPEMAKLAEFQAKWGAGHTGLKQADVSQSIRDMAKSTEGAAMLQKDPKVFDKFADNLLKSLISAGGNVSATQYLQAQRAARAAAFGWTDSFRFGVFPAMVQEYSHNAGVMLQQSFTKLVAEAQWTSTGLTTGIKMGLIDPNKVVYSKIGTPLRLDPGGSIFGKEYAEDPLKYVEKHITPWLDAHTKNVGERASVLTRLLGRGTASSAVIAFDTQAFKFEKDRALWGKARIEIPDGYEEALKALQEKWQDFIIAVGTPSLKAATEALGGITKAIVALTGVVTEHPGAAKNLLAVAAGFGVAMTALGALTVSYGIAGLLAGGVIIVGITALTGSLAGLAAANWPTVSSGIQTLITKLNEFSDACRHLATVAFEKIIAFVKGFGTVIEQMWNKLKNFDWNPLHHMDFEGGGFGGDSGGIIRTSYGGAAAAIGGGTGGGQGPGTAARGTLLGNQKLAYAAAIAEGLSSTAARALVANMSGEALNKPGDYHWDVSHMAQGIVQWDPARAAAIKGHFGKFPKDMSVGEQTKAAIWEMKNKYPRTWAALMGHGSPESMIDALVRDYERPRDAAGAIHQRERYYRGLPQDLALPHVAPYRKPSAPTIIENTMYLDGSPIHRSVVGRILAHATHPTSAPLHDGSRHWTPPDSGLVGA